MLQPARQVSDEHLSLFQVASADTVRRDELRVGVDSYPRPHVAPSLLGLVRLDVLAASRRRTPKSRPPVAAHTTGRASSRSIWTEQAVPRSTKSFVTVFLATPVMRTVARMLLPSTRQAMTWRRFSVMTGSSSSSAAGSTVTREFRSSVEEDRAAIALVRSMGLSSCRGILQNFDSGRPGLLSCTWARNALGSSKSGKAFSARSRAGAGRAPSAKPASQASLSCHDRVLKSINP